MKQKFDVSGMTCSACSAHVEKSVKKLPGIHTVNVNLLELYEKKTDMVICIFSTIILYFNGAYDGYAITYYTAWA